MPDRSASISTHGTSYKRGTLFFPQPLRDEVHLLYAFVRKADEYVDSNQRNHTQAALLLHTMSDDFHQSYRGALTYKPLIDQFASLCRRKDIDPQRVDAFFDAMLADTHPASYLSYEDLHEYMIGSAEVIGLMMCQLIGYDPKHKDTVHQTARLLGEAMQYTNFLRDIAEDRDELGRIYIPQDRLNQSNLSHTLLRKYTQPESQVDTKRKDFMNQQISILRKQYRDANQGIKYLNKQGRFGVYVASTLYEGILDKIENIEYDVFTQDAHTTKREKAKLFTQAVYTYVSL